MEKVRHKFLLSMCLYCIVASLVFYTVVVTVSDYNSGSFLRKLNQVVPWDTSGWTDFIERTFYTEDDYIDNTTDPSQPAFMALRPKGARGGFIPAEVHRGHLYLRQRTYPRTPRRKKCKNCFPFTYRHVLTPRVCDGHERVDLLILITTIPDTVSARAAIRATWGSFSRTNKGKNITKHVFLFGKGWDAEEQATIVSEHEKYGDILQTDYIDSYFNLSLKVLSGFRWFSTSCSQARFVLRTADDNFINFPNLLSLIAERGHEMKDAITGRCGLRSDPIRTAVSKWYVSYNEYPFKHYPAYCVGTAFVTSRKLTYKLIKASVNVPYFIMEDVYFGLVLKKIYRNSLYGILDVKGFNLTLDLASLTCPTDHRWYAVHDVGPEEIRKLWTVCQRDVQWLKG